MKKHFSVPSLLLIVLLHGPGDLLGSPSPGSVLEARRLLREGSTMIDTSLILRARELFIQIHEKESSPVSAYFIAQAEYELVRIGLAKKGSGLFEQYYDSALERLEHIVQIKPDWSEAYALLSHLHGFKIAYSWINAITHGPKAYYLAERAVLCDINNPRAWLVQGTAKLHMPSFLGGGAPEAIKAFSKAVELFEQRSLANDLEPDWGYIDALAWLGWAFEKNDQPDEALQWYNKGLRIEPRATWITTMFLEPLQKKLHSH